MYESKPEQALEGGDRCVPHVSRKPDEWCIYGCAGELGHEPLSSWYVCDAGLTSLFGSAAKTRLTHMIEDG